MGLPLREPDASFSLSEADWRAWRRDVIVRRFGAAGALLTALGVGSWGVVGGAWWAVAALVGVVWGTLLALGLFVDRRALDDRLLRSGTWRLWLEDDGLVLDYAMGTLWLAWRRLSVRRRGQLLLVRVGQAWLLLRADALTDAVRQRLSARCGKDGPPPHHAPDPGYDERAITYRADLRWRSRVLRAASASTFRGRVLPWIAVPVVAFTQILACGGVAISAPAQTASVLWLIIATLPWWRPWLGAWLQGRGVRDPTVQLGLGPAGLWLRNDAGTSRVSWERVVACRRSPGLALLDLGGQLIGLPDPVGEVADAVDGWRLRQREGVSVEAPPAGNPFEAPGRD